MKQVWSLLQFAALTLQIGISLSSASVASASTTELESSFPVGSGSKFSMSSKGVKTEVLVYVVAHGPTSLSFETYFSSPTILSMIHLWQRFELAFEKNQAPKLLRGWIQDDKTDRPETLPADMQRGAGDLDVTEFFFAQNSKALEKLKIGEEEIVVPAGKTRTSHYRKVNGSQKIDFWISNEAKPLGLVKLTSKSDKELENYELELVSLITRTPEKIDIKRAVPLSERMKKMLVASR